MAIPFPDYESVQMYHVEFSNLYDISTKMPYHLAAFLHLHESIK